MSISKSRYLKSWKRAKLIPLYKGKGISRTDTSSYRPVSILPAMSKVVDKVVHQQLSNFMEKSGQLSHNLHVYRNGYSTTSAMLQLSDSILQAVDSNLISTVVTIDESAAFDCVCPYLLDKKLQLYNVDKSTRDWIMDYMTDRELFVEIGTKKSDKVSVSRGVPQGSVLGLLLFTIYTNELPEVIVDRECQENVHKEMDRLFQQNCRKCGSIPAFADDASVVMETKTRVWSQELVNKVTTELKSFLNSQDLSVNMSKTNLFESMVKQKRTRLKGSQPIIETVNAKGEEKTIKPQQSIRLLGVNLEQNLTWNSHILTGEKALLPAMRQQLGALTANRSLSEVNFCWPTVSYWAK